MNDKEENLRSKIWSANGAVNKFNDATFTYVWVSYAGCVVIALAGIFTGWNWFVISYAGAATLTTCVVSAFAGLQSAKLKLEIAVAQAESEARQTNR